MISLLKISLVALPALALSAACSESATEPPGSDAVINLATSGGFAGVDFALSVDGPLGVIRGLRCASFCDWEEGDVLAEVSSADVAELESKFDAVDFLAGEDEDFGDECCDQFHYELTFIRGDESRTIMGSSEKLPAAVAALAQEIEQWVTARREAGEGSSQ